MVANICTNFVNLHYHNDENLLNLKSITVNDNLKYYLKSGPYNGT